ncbi:hypothetical protein ABH926_008020 [Catenulispora sp. GP43]|uniref:hypothetical protein n=1 Tax=Catenulispora sp. GP43 TaxID=3156263 RepID=UPI00351111E6
MSGGGGAAGGSYWSGGPDGPAHPNRRQGPNDSAAPNTPARDARRLPRPPRDARRVEPRQPAIWVRVDGRWLPGHIQCWFTHRGRWACWLSYQADPAHPTVAALWGLFAYDPASIVSRAAHPTPPGAS